ncbi:MAG: ABC transporter permease [Bacilli bacterium]|nr:ABC transporter permease [Bacilli bacterium]
MKNDNKQRPIDTIVDEEFLDSDFEFVHTDKDAKIHDEKFQSKPTTFAKDAFRRFVKNKASVVGAIIIGVLLLSSFLSALSPYKISEADPGYGLMLPKIRDGGDGFWDGTETYKKAYDAETGMPIASDEKFNQRAVIKESLQVLPEYEYYTEPNANGHFGFYHLTAAQTKRGFAFFQNYSVEKGPYLNLKDTDGAKLKITIGGTDGINGNHVRPFDINLRYRKYNDFYDTEKLLPLATDIITDKEEESFDIDIGAAMTEASVTSAYYAQISIEFPIETEKTLDENGKEVETVIPDYILIEKMEFTCEETATDHAKQRLAEISFTDAGGNAFEMGPNNQHSKKHTGYWQSNVKSNLYKARCQMCTFRYDQYVAIFGLRENLNAYYGKKIIMRFVERGLATLSDPDDLSTFALVNPDSDECPVRSIVKMDFDPVEEPDMAAKYPDGYCYTVLGYRHFGFTSIPKFVFGTDNGGRDLLTLALSCLKNSLLLAIITSAICLSIGLVWGSISGYFGGNVDLIMERITDILSGVPWIVVMTLVMILLGRTYITFGIAVCLTGWIGTSSRTRTQFYRFKGREYVLASRTLGASDARLIFRHILPNGLGTIVTGSVLMIPTTIFSEATLSYLGLGLQGTDSFGVVLSENQKFLQTRPALVIFPAIIISLLMISFNLFGNGLRDALNPTLKGGEQ